MEPSRQLGYLVHHLSFVIDRQSDQVLRERLGVGFSQFKILTALRQREGIQQKQIANYLGQTEAGISRQIGYMGDRGWLISKVNPYNRREHIIVLTDKGTRLAAAAMNTLNQYHAPMFARLTERQQAQLADILNTMHEQVCKLDRFSHTGV